MVSKRRPRRSDRVLRLSKLSLENFIIDIRDLLEKPETQDSFKKVPFSYSFYERLQLTCILEAFFSFFGRRWNSCRFSIYKFLFKKSRPGRNSTTHRFRPGCPIFSQWRNLYKGPRIGFSIVKQDNAVTTHHPQIPPTWTLHRNLFNSSNTINGSGVSIFAQYLINVLLY